MTITRTALCVLTAALFVTAASLSVAAVILTMLGTLALFGTFAVGHTTPPPPIRLDHVQIHVEPEDAIPAGYPNPHTDIQE